MPPPSAEARPTTTWEGTSELPLRSAALIRTASVGFSVTSVQPFGREKWKPLASTARAAGRLHVGGRLGNVVGGSDDFGSMESEAAGGSSLACWPVSLPQPASSRAAARAIPVFLMP